MERNHYEPFSTLDDSSMWLQMRTEPEIPYRLQFYAHSLQLSEERSNYLIILKPNEAKVDCCAQKLREFLNENVEGTLVSCKHYTDLYEWVKTDFNTKTIFSGNRKLYSDEILNRFALSDKDAYTKSEKAKIVFSKDMGFKENRKRLVDAVKNNEDFLDVGFRIYLRGLHIV